jgi:hypothetical protein
MLVFLKVATLQRHERSGGSNCIKTAGYREVHIGKWGRQRPRKPTAPLRSQAAVLFRRSDSVLAQRLLTKTHTRKRATTSVF